MALKVHRDAQWIAGQCDSNG